MIHVRRLLRGLGIIAACSAIMLGTFALAVVALTYVWVGVPLVGVALLALAYASGRE